VTIKALLPSPRYTCHDVTYSVLRNIRSLLTNCIFKAVNVREGVSTHTHPDTTTNPTLALPDWQSHGADFPGWSTPNPKTCLFGDGGAACPNSLFLISRAPSPGLPPAVVGRPRLSTHPSKHGLPHIYYCFNFFLLPSLQYYPFCS
jgi:hypothetical protein